MTKIENSVMSHLSKILLLLFILVILLVVIPYTYSRYESSATSETKSKIAYYLLETNYMSESINLTNLVPSDEPYIYTFSIANNDGTKRLETRLEYDLLIKTTTNLPLTYELYMNEDYALPSSTNIITTQNDVIDEHGTYFKEIKVAKEYFNFLTDEENNYTLLIYFPKQFISYQYQDVIESIDIIVDSKQLLE